MLSLQVNSYQSKKRSKLIRYSEPWMSMEMESSKKMKSKMDMQNSSEEISLMRKLMKCSTKLMQMEVEKLNTLSLW